MILKLLKYHWRAIIWVLIIVIACLIPEKDIPGSGLLSKIFEKIPHFDKLVHFTLYCIFTLFLMSGFSRQYGKTAVKSFVYSFSIAVLLGLAIEFLQPAVNRSGDIYDMAANTLGIIVSLVLFNPVKWILRNIL